MVVSIWALDSDCVDLNPTHLSDDVTLDELLKFSVPQFLNLDKLGITIVPTSWSFCED